VWRAKGGKIGGKDEYKEGRRGAGKYGREGGERNQAQKGGGGKRGLGGRARKGGELESGRRKEVERGVKGKG